MKKLLSLGLALLLIFSLIGCETAENDDEDKRHRRKEKSDITAIPETNSEETEPTETSTEPQTTPKPKIVTIQFIPYAYVGEVYDLRQTFLMEDGVEYSATACYVEKNFDDISNQFTFQEYALEIHDLCFTPPTVAEIVVTLTATRGEETVSKVIYVPTAILAEPLDELYQSSGILGIADPGITKTVNMDPAFVSDKNSATSLHVEFNSMDPHPWGNLLLSLSAPAAQQHFTDKTWKNAIVTMWVYNPNELPIEFQLRLVDEAAGTNLDWNGAEGPHKQRAEPGQWTQIHFSLKQLGTTHVLTSDNYSNEMLSLKFRYDGYSTETVYSFDFYIDNIDVVDASMYP